MTTFRRRRVQGGLAVALLAGGLPFLAVLPAPAVPGPGSPPQEFNYLRSTNGGSSFTPGSLADASVEAEQTHVEASATAVHALYDDFDPSPRRLFYRRSTNAGSSFSPSVRLDVPRSGAAVEVGDSGEADIHADASTVHVVWEDDRLLAADFTVPPADGVPSFETLNGIRLRNDVTFSDGTFWPVEQPNGDPENDLDNTVIPSGTVIPAGSVDPRADINFYAVNDSRVTNAARTRNRDEVYYAQSTDDGVSFPVGRNLTDSDDVHDTDPDPAASGSTVIIAHEGEDVVSPITKSLLVDVWALSSTDGGATFTDTNLTNAPGRQDEPSVTLEGSDVTIAFRQEPVDPDGGGPLPQPERRTAFVHSGDGGSSYSTMAELPGTRPATAVHSTPHVYASGSTVLVAACENDDPSELVDGDEAFKLLQWTSTDGGATFPNQPAVLASGPESCTRPHYDGAGSSVKLVYEQDVRGQADVFLLGSSNGGAGYGSPRNLSADPYDSTDPIVSVNPANASQVHISWNDPTTFLFTMDFGDDLPLPEGGERRFANEDVIRYTGGAFEMVFDGSDVGLRDFRIDALSELSPTQLLLSFTSGGSVPGVGSVDDSDIVLFTATSLGNTTVGTFSLWFDGSDVGLTGNSEDVDAIEFQLGNLYLSTTGNYSAKSGVAAVSGKDEDVFRCSGLVAGATTSCAGLDLPFDGSAVGLGDSGDDVDAFSFDNVDPVPDPTDPDGQVPERQAFFSFDDAFRTPTTAGTEFDIARCVFPNANTTPTLPDLPEPVYGLADCGGPNVSLFTDFLSDAHGLTENIAALEFEY